VTFARFSSLCAYLAAVAGLAYSVTFVATTDDDSRFGEGLEGAFLLAGGLLAVVVFAALHQLVREREPGFALLGLLLGVGGGFGAAIHGAYQLALAVEGLAAEDLPNAIDPRGFLTFGVTAAAVALFAALLEGRLRLVGFVFAVLLAILWIGRLVGGDADDVALLLPAALAGLVANPLWYVLVGRLLGRAHV
jgi:ABC-type amino acid transport substrate-binding protein